MFEPEEPAIGTPLSLAAIPTDYQQSPALARIAAFTVRYLMSSTLRSPRHRQGTETVTSNARWRSATDSLHQTISNTTR